MEDIILIDKVPFSGKIHRWYCKDNISLYSPTFDWDSTLVAFKHILPKCPQTNRKKFKLAELDCAEFYQLLQDVTLVADGLRSKNKLGTDIQISDIEKDIEKIKAMIMFWALTEKLPLDRFGDIDPFLIEKDKGRTSKTFHFNCYYIIQNLELRFTELKECFKQLCISSIQDKPFKQFSSKSQKYKTNLGKILQLIRKAYTGDLEDFIVGAMHRIQFFKMNDNHEKLAQMVRFQYLHIPNFKEKLPAHETWRFLFPTYFDKFEEVFDEFFDEFPSYCIDYYMNDYLNDTFGIVHIPFYYCYCNTALGEIHDNIITTIDVDDFVKTECERYNKELPGIPFKSMPESRYN